MRLALVTTTVHVPEVLRLVRAIGPEIHIFIAGDKKSPHAEIEHLCEQLGLAIYLRPEEQAQWKCSELIGWNCIQRRNIATLEALKRGYTHIYTWDTDNIPIDEAHFDLMEHAFTRTAGPLIDSVTGWFDPGQMLLPVKRQRGFPSNIKSIWNVGHIVDAKVGVAAGACLGDSDVDACERIARKSDAYNTQALMRSGVVVDNKTWTIFNSQNTAFVRDLAPCMFMLPFTGRYDDIFASLITQCVMREHGYHVHYGKPFTWQQRNVHCLHDDLKAEVPWMDKVEPFAEWLDKLSLASRLIDPPPLAGVKHIFQKLQVALLRNELQWSFDPRTIDAAFAWFDDCEKAMVAGAKGVAMGLPL